MWRPAGGNHPGRGMTTASGGPGEADWRALEKLFAGGPADFRHRLGISKGSVRDFYGATGEAAAIRAQKEAVLGLPDAAQYRVETAEGEAPLHEFTRALGLPAALTEAERDGPARHRAVTLALEPDWLLLSAPDWRLVWASVCFPTRWSLVGKAGLPLPDIHAAVPGLNGALGRQIGGFFGRLPPGEGWARANWGLTASPERNQHPSRPTEPLSGRTPAAAVSVRVESQHLYKLPQTGAIAFGIRILHFPWAGVRERPRIAAGLQSQLRTMPGEVAAYKGIPPGFWLRL